MIDISDLSGISDRPSPDWSIPKHPKPNAGVEPTRALFPQRPVIQPITDVPVVIPATPPANPKE
jgi:hypothetical protein